MVLNGASLRSAGAMLWAMSLCATLWGCDGGRPADGVRPAPTEATAATQIQSIAEHRLTMTDGRSIELPREVPAAIYQSPGLALMEANGFVGGARLAGVCGDTPEYVARHMSTVLEQGGWQLLSRTGNETISECTYRKGDLAIAVTSRVEHGVTTVTTQIEQVGPEGARSPNADADKP
ncbi:MAG: hypothetical protein GC162_03485 [Planctomycetes bacterium]|nr:hypothetical protein [Planctomycetota bacterium]